MSLTLTAEQTALRDSAHKFLHARSPVAYFRRLRNTVEFNGYSHELWKEFAAMGWTGLLVDSEWGGTGFGYVGAGLIAEEVGRYLAPCPFLSCSMIAAVALDRFASSIQKERLLPQLCAGELRFALAVDEHAKHDPRAIATTAKPCDNGFKLNGQKFFIPDGGIADWFIVVARTEAPAPENPFAVVCVDATAPGVSRSPLRTLDGRTAARVRFDQVEVPNEAVLAAPSHAEPILRTLLGVGRAGLAAEMLGMAEELFRMTLEYLKVRRQFGRTIGSFQALQHRASRLFVELQLARSAVLYALQQLDEDSAKAELACVAAKAKMGEVANLCCAEAIQMHGGIGVTDEHDIGLYLKRIRVAQETMGDYAFLANEFALLSGY